MKANDAENRALRLLSEVNGWLRFAEAKNGALLAISCATIVGLLQAGPSVCLPALASWYIKYFIACALLSVVAMLASFYSKVDATVIDFFKSSPSKPNFFFFGDLGKMSEEDLFQKLGTEDLDEPQQEIVRLLCHQIIANSRIAAQKFRFFNFGISCLVAGLLTPLGLLLFHWRMNEKI